MEPEVSATWDAEPQTPRRARDLLTTFLSCQHLDDLIPTAAQSPGSSCAAPEAKRR